MTLSLLVNINIIIIIIIIIIIFIINAAYLPSDMSAMSSAEAVEASSISRVGAMRVSLALPSEDREM
jgi:hypothetical protein